MIEQLQKYNEFYMQNLSHGDENCEAVFAFTNRFSSLIMSAPHSTRSFINKKERIADLYTGALVRYIGETNQISTIIRNKYTPCKVLISDFIEEQQLQNHYFLDIHGFNTDVGADICLGIADMPEQNYPYLAQIIKIANQFGLTTIVNHPNYTGRYGLCGRYQQKCQKPNVIQMELMPRLRNFYENSETVQNVTIPFFEKVIELYQQKAEK